MALETLLPTSDCPSSAPEQCVRLGLLKIATAGLARFDCIECLTSSLHRLEHPLVLGPLCQIILDLLVELAKRSCSAESSHPWGLNQGDRDGGIAWGALLSARGSQQAASRFRLAELQKP